MVDIESVSAIAHRQPDVIVVVDNTFESAYFQKPLNLGADVSYYSVTKERMGENELTNQDLKKIFKKNTVLCLTNNLNIIYNFIQSTRYIIYTSPF
jgi:hypothetical protein